MKTQIVSFENRDDIRLIESNNEVWFCAKDVCFLLGLSNSSQALSRLDDYERGSFEMSTFGGNQQTAFVSESGLYALILRSKKPDAKAFRKWITSEVLPTIRRTGSFIDDNQALTTLDKNEIYQNLTNRIALLESAITPTQLAIINATEELPKRLKDVYDFDTPAGFWTEKTMMVDLFYSVFTDEEINTIPLKKGLAMLISALTALNCKFKHGKHFVLLPPKK